MATREELHEEVDALPDPQVAKARVVVEDPEAEERRRALLDRFTARFMDPENAGIDWDLLREGKLRAWPLP